MHKVLLKFLLVGLLLVLLAAASVIVYLSTQDINEYKDRIEGSFFTSTGLKISIGGEITVDLSTDLSITLRNIQLDDSLGILAEADSIILQTYWSWPKDTLKITNAQVYSPVYHYRLQGIIPIKPGPPSQEGSGTAPYIYIDSINVRNGLFKLYNTDDSLIVNAEGISSNDAVFRLDLSKPILHAFHVTANTEIENSRAFFIPGQSMNCAFEMINGYLHFNITPKKSPSDNMLFTMDLNPDKLRYCFKGKIFNKDIRTLYYGLEKEYDFYKGAYSADFDFNFSALDSIELNTLHGYITLHSSNSYLIGLNLDKLIKSFKRTQNFSMKDFGSVVLLGPWGLALSKGTDYAELAVATKKDSSLVEQLNLHVTFDSGLVQFDDVAFRTQKHRIALSGDIDIINSTYNAFAYAIIDDDNCSEIREEFNGSFEETGNKDKDGVAGVKMVLGPVTNLFKGTSSITKGKDCDHPYNGVVKAPEKKIGFFAKKTPSPQKEDAQKKKKNKKRRKKREKDS